MTALPAHQGCDAVTACLPQGCAPRCVSSVASRTPLPLCVSPLKVAKDAKGEERRILDSVSGYVQPKGMLAIM